jgi:hypothetical protein
VSIAGSIAVATANEDGLLGIVLDGTIHLSVPEFIFIE